jgi:hypothetical protein
VDTSPNPPIRGCGHLHSSRPRPEERGGPTSKAARCCCGLMAEWRGSRRWRPRPKWALPCSLSRTEDISAMPAARVGGGGWGDWGPGRRRVGFSDAGALSVAAAGSRLGGSDP